MKRHALVFLVVAVLASAREAQAQGLIATYYRCSTANEGEANFIMNTVLGDVFQRHVDAGHLGGWAWYAHDIGGRFRRLLTVLAADDFDVLDGRDMVIEELASEHSEIWAEFGSICGNHVDYLWGNARSGGDN